MLVVVTVSTGVPAVILSVAYKYFWQLGLALESFWCYQILATKSLKVESDRVYIALKDKGLEAGRKAVSMIVGRDTQNLTEEGVTKAAVETVAENTSDGVIAPLFYMLIGGAVLGFTYKAINTMDSMVGYKNDKYQWFGTAAAKLDDVVNFIPARVSAVLMILAAYLTGMDGKNAARIFEETALIIKVRTRHRQKQSWRGRWMCSLQEMRGILESCIRSRRSEIRSGRWNYWISGDRISCYMGRQCLV